jgi:hypothetical protein
MSELVVERCDPRDREAEIKGLFARNDQPGFDAVFERAYRPRAQHGMNSWVGMIGDEAVMHVSVSPVPFHRSGDTIMAGVLGDLMVDEGHRDFWGPMRLLRTMVSDLTREGNIDFLFTTTVEDAESLFKAAGFKPFATLRRYVLPLSLPYLGFVRMRSRAAKLTAALCSVQAVEWNPALAHESADHWRPSPSTEFYGTRIPRHEHADGTWVTIGRKNAGEAGQVLLSRNSTLKEFCVADALWCDDSARLGDVLLSAARWARAERVPRLTISTLEESRVAQQLTDAGFFARAIRSQILLRPLSKAAPPPVEDWFLTGLALSGW